MQITVIFPCLAGLLSLMTSWREWDSAPPVAHLNENHTGHRCKGPDWESQGHFTGAERGGGPINLCLVCVPSGSFSQRHQLSFSTLYRIYHSSCCRSEGKGQDFLSQKEEQRRQTIRSNHAIWWMFFMCVLLAHAGLKDASPEREQLK